MLEVRALEFYSGIGGLHLALSRSTVKGSVVQAFDWDQAACQVYTANHSQNIVKKVDISTLTASSLVPFHANLWLLSPACQPYTVLNPNAKGESDPRAKSFLHLIQNVLPQLATTNSHPSYLLVENVAGFETSNTRQILLFTLRSLGYATLELLITPLQYGIPNSRLRYYLLAKLAPLSFAHVSADLAYSNKIWQHIPGHHHWIDPRLEPPPSDDLEASVLDYPVHQIKEYLDDDPCSREIPHPNMIPETVLMKWGRLFDIVLPSSCRTCCFTRGYSQLVERAGSILQTNASLDTTEIFNAFLQAQLDGDTQAVHILRPLGLRYFTPAELLRLFDFTPLHHTSNFFWPGGMSTKTKYRLIGNSVNVKVVQELISYLFES